MPGLLLHVMATVQCPHQGPALSPPAQTRVLVMGQPVATAANLFTIAGCVFTVPGPKPQPCVTIKWSMPATRVMVMGVPALLAPAPGAGAGICLSVEQIPAGPPLISQVQTRVTAM
jgi:hypothetical protein